MTLYKNGFLALCSLDLGLSETEQNLDLSHHIFLFSNTFSNDQKLNWEVATFQKVQTVKNLLTLKVYHCRLSVEEQHFFVKQVFLCLLAIASDLETLCVCASSSKNKWQAQTLPKAVPERCPKSLAIDFAVNTFD